MALIRRNENQNTMQNRVWDPFQMMDAMLGWDPFRELGGFSPAFDVHETRDAYLLSADLPGLSEDALELTVTGNQLTISGRREEESRGEGDRVHMVERRYGAFSRTFALPDGVDTEHVEAQLKHGVLKVTVPKKPEIKPRKISLGKLLRSSSEAA